MHGFKGDCKKKKNQGYGVKKEMRWSQWAKEMLQ